MQGSPAKTCLQQLVKGELDFGPLIACAAKGVLLRSSDCDVHLQSFMWRYSPNLPPFTGPVTMSIPLRLIVTAWL